MNTPIRRLRNSTIILRRQIAQLESEVERLKQRLDVTMGLMSEAADLIDDYCLYGRDAQDLLTRLRIASTVLK